jgi:hypothetical protein
MDLRDPIHVYGFVKVGRYWRLATDCLALPELSARISLPATFHIHRTTPAATHTAFTGRRQTQMAIGGQAAM